MRANRRALLVAAGLWAMTIPAPAAGRVVAQDPPQASPCLVSTRKYAEPARLPLGDLITVTLGAGWQCPSRPATLHVVLAIDGSSSMLSDGKLEAAREAARRFVGLVDPLRTRVGVVSFHGSAVVAAELTDRQEVLTAAIDGIQTDRGTDIAGAIDLSREVLGRGRTGAVPAPIEALVVMSDGRQTAGQGQTGAELVAAAAGRAWSDGILVAAICFGGDCQAAVMRQAASRADLYFDAAGSEELVAVYAGLAGQLARTAVRTLEIVDALPSNMRYVPGSASPEPSQTGPDRLAWTWAVVPDSGVTVTFRLEPLQPGVWPTNREARTDYVDTGDMAGSAAFPVPVVEVIAPTPTCTPTPSPSPSPTVTTRPTDTATPSPRYLPLVLRERCVPEIRRVDAVIVLDASTSMLEHTSAGRTRLEAARAGAGLFLDGLRLHAGDQVGVVTFNAGATLAQPLTGDRAAVERALGSAAVARQTRLDLGIREARLELMGWRHRRSSRPVIVVLTDGLANPVPVQAAVDQAEVAKSLDHLVFSVGIGRDLAWEALAEMASRPEYFYVTDDGEGLLGILAAIAETIPCPVDAYWTGR